LDDGSMLCERRVRRYRPRLGRSGCRPCPRLAEI
jgi:hypothetical protein